MILRGFLGGLLGFLDDGESLSQLFAFLPPAVASPDSSEGAEGGQECTG